LYIFKFEANTFVVLSQTDIKSIMEIM